MRIGFHTMRLSVSTIFFATLCSHTSYAGYSMPEINCTAGLGYDSSATLSCYTCLGRDSVNCDWGTTCCKGSCFKLIDEKHDIIAKGCTNMFEEDESMRKKNTMIELSWANNEPLSGSSMISSVILLLVAVGVLTAAL